MKYTDNIEGYRMYLFRKELSAGTEEIYMRQARMLLDFLDGRAITKEEMIAYKKYLSDKGLAVSTLNLYIVAANSYLRYAGYGECRVKTNKIQRRKSLENVISIEEYNRMLAYAKESGREKYYYIMKTMALTGIRVGELKFFTVEILNQEMITVNNKGKTREVYLPDKLLVELRNYCQKAHIESGAIFKGNSTNQISRIGVYKMLTHMADMLGIPKERVHPHSFRHLFAITYMNRYGNISELSDILGHSSLETTRIYAVTSIQEKRQKMEKLGL